MTSDWWPFLGGGLLRAAGWYALIAAALMAIARTVSLATGAPEAALHLQAPLLAEHLRTALGVLVVVGAAVLLDRLGAWLIRSRVSTIPGEAAF